MDYLVGEFINYIKKIVNDEFDYCIDCEDSEHYFLNNGCLEFAKVLHHYLEDSHIVLRDDWNHFAIEYRNHIYDASGKIKEKDLYRRLTPEELINIEKNYTTSELNFENQLMHSALIWEVGYCSGVYVRKLIQQINQV